MPFAFIHLAAAWLFGKAYQAISKKPISHTTWVFLLFGSILPDIDHLIDWTFQLQIHRSFTHSLFFVVFSGSIVYLLCRSLRNVESKSFAIAISFGVLTHLLLDMISYPGIQLLWPSQLHFSINSISYLTTQPSLFHLPPIELSSLLKLAVVDMAVGTTWLFYFAFRKHIKF